MIIFDNIYVVLVQKSPTLPHLSVKCWLILQLSEMVGYGTGTKLSIESAEIIARA
ncbi:MULTISPECIES: hypothetical protein [Aerosakkonema]|uniref:hypothetical protein n=1 Tax=Aerosakkonema TaxID=1246629 RepID=UPI0035B6E6AB